jgi:hypothetical protein
MKIQRYEGQLAIIIVIIINITDVMIIIINITDVMIIIINFNITFTPSLSLV